MSKIKDSNLRREAEEEIGQFLVDYIIDQVGSSKSPVEGGRFDAALTKKYKKIKSEISGSSKANLELFGDMLDSIDYKTNNGNIEVGIFNDEEQASKAYGHNSGYRGHPTIKYNKYKREFIPKSNQSFKSSANKEIDRIINDYASEDQE